MSKEFIFYRTVRDWNVSLMTTVHMLLPKQFEDKILSYHKLYLTYSTSCGERETRPFHEEP